MRDPRLTWAVAAVLAAMGCGARSAADAGAVPPPETSPGEPGASAARRPEPDPGPPVLPTAPALGPELEAVRAWALSARPGGSIERVERRGPGDAWFHVVARDGDTVLDAWIESTRASAAAYWRVAELVALVRGSGVDHLERADDWTLLMIEGRTLLCGVATDAPCLALPTPAALGLFFCGPPGRCTVHEETGAGRIEEWLIEPARQRRRIVRTWLARAGALAGPLQVGSRGGQGRWQPLDAVDRPGALADPRLAAPASLADDDPETGSDPCTPTVRSARRADTVVRVVGCGRRVAWSDGRWPDAIVTTRDGRTDVMPIRVFEPGSPEPLRIVALDVLAPPAIGVEMLQSDGASPNGCSSEELWALVPPGPQGPRVDTLDLSASCSDGLGNEGDGEGYVVAVDRRRWTFEVVGPGVGRYTGCERWSGTHSRGTDRWRGARRAAPLDVRVAFDPERGFEISDADRALLHNACAPAEVREE